MGQITLTVTSDVSADVGWSSLGGSGTFHLAMDEGTATHDGNSSYGQGANDLDILRLGVDVSSIPAEAKTITKVEILSVANNFFPGGGEISLDYRFSVKGVEKAWVNSGPMTMLDYILYTLNDASWDGPFDIADFINIEPSIRFNDDNGGKGSGAARVTAFDMRLTYSTGIVAAIRQGQERIIQGFPSWR